MTYLFMGMLIGAIAGLVIGLTVQCFMLQSRRSAD